MRILYLHQYFCPPGGAGNNRSYELAMAWVQAGHEVTILTSTAYFPSAQKSTPTVQELDFDGLKVIALPVAYDHLMPFKQRVLAFLRFYWKGLGKAKRLPKPDVIYASSTPPTVGEMGRKLSRHWKVPYVFETVDVWPDVPIGMGILTNRWLIDWINRRTNRIYTEANAIVALSDGMRDQVLSHGVPADKVHVGYNGTNLSAFPFQARAGLDGLHVIYAGTVGLANGCDAIVRLCASIEAMGRDDIRFTILGGGNDLARVKALANAQGLQQIQFIDTVPKAQVAPILASADVGIVTFAPHPVLEANSANKFYDYLASGLPVLINYEGWQAQYLRTFECGLSAPMGDDAALLAHVLLLADAPALRLQMAQRGRQLAEARFDRQQIADQVLQLLMEAIR